jgi:TfoX/Sxy family transcriptional regulator of competence genes
MVYSKSLAARIRQIVGNRPGVVEKKMFGGVGFMLGGKMLVGIWQNSLIARLGPEQGAQALEEPHVREFDITGRAMKGWVMVEPDGIENDGQLSRWIARAVEFVETLPAK